ncbi:MAG TPA: CHAP domain-containing protein [Solirubrobacterales bacterium]|nr:CHAP domain-containing protein [Solirubrobacterales bacterium]
MSAALRSPWPLALAAAVAALLAALVGTLMALLGAQLACMGGGGSAGPAPSRSALGEIPAARLRIYQAAGRRFDLSWPFLASIGTQECGTSGTCAGVNASGCAGPMQIAYVRKSPCSPGSGPTLWERFAVDGNGDGTKDVNELADAIFTAARILRQNLGAPPAGGSYAAYRQAACRYYGACADAVANYADEVMARAVRYGFGRRSAAAEAPQQAAVQGPACEGSALGGASGQAIVRIAERQLGREERPPGSNCTPYGPCEEWCSLFLAWVWEHAGVPMRGGTAPYAYSGSIYEWARAHGGRILLPGATPAPGDAVLFGWGPSASEHVAIVERVFPGGEITTIDGNYANRVARVGPYPPSLDVLGGEPAPVYAYAQPPGVGAAEGSVNG